MALTFQAVMPGPFLADAFQREMEKTLEDIGAGMLVDFDKTVSTWDNQPTFEIEMTPANDRFVDVHVFCDALAAGERVKYSGPIRKGVLSSGGFTPANLVYFFLNYGTKVRYAHMSHPFRPKSRVRTLGSYPGVGWMWKVDIHNPNPGIVAREWDSVIAAKYNAILPSQLGAALKRAARASGHAI